MPKKSLEKRTFKRYKAETDFELKINKDKFKCKMVDYSDGMNAIIYGTPPIKPGSRLNIKIPDPMIEFKGEVVWAKKLSSETWIGVRRLSLINGLLKDFHLADILIGLQRSTKTGVLEIKSGLIRKRIFIEKAI